MLVPNMTDETLAYIVWTFRRTGTRTCFRKLYLYFYAPLVPKRIDVQTMHAECTHHMYEIHGVCHFEIIRFRSTVAVLQVNTRITIVHFNH